MTLELIWAESRNGIIGDSNNLVWNFKNDMDYFKKTTINNTIVMGRKTFESIGIPLPKRRNIVMTKESSYKNLEVMTFEEVIELSKDERVIIVGGLQIYKLFIEYADVIYQTIIEKDYKGDTEAPTIPTNLFNLTSQSQIYEDSTLLKFNKYERVR